MWLMQIISNITFEHSTAAILKSALTQFLTLNVNFFAFQRPTSAVIYFTYHAYQLVVYLVQASFIRKYY